LNFKTQHDAVQCTKHRLAVTDTLELLSGKWKLPIIVTLSFRPYRFKELAREVGITPRMLSKELKDLEINELVTRSVKDTKPVTVEYAMAPYAKSLDGVIREMKNWGEKHRARIMRKR
jgi:DNA-binding HxlR family transcriptional regulator